MPIYEGLDRLIFHAIVLIVIVFGQMNDPRVTGRCEHQLLVRVIIAVFAVITGAAGNGETESQQK